VVDTTGKMLYFWGDGEDRICADLIRATRGKAFGKIGGEGVYGVCLFEQRWGMAVKIEDGSLRGVAPTVVEVLKKLGILSDEELGMLKRYQFRKVVNYRKEIVGQIRPVVGLKTPGG
jgi:L-asparaginase II